MRPLSIAARGIGWLLISVSLALHILTVFAFARQPDSLAAYTVMPIWIWGALGLALSGTAHLFLRAPLSLVVTTIWALTLLLGADEARIITNLGTPAPQPGPPEPVDGTRPIRVITLNAANFRHGDPSDDLAAWQPDIVILQETAGHQVRAIAQKLFADQGDSRSFALNGVATRWKITREVRNPDRRYHTLHHNVTILHPDGRRLEVANLHLSSAATNLRLWQADCWRVHRDNRRQRKIEMAAILRTLEDTTAFPGIQPVILAGDFNAPAGDPVQRQLDRDFDDAFRAAGTGWGNTFQRRIPILRLDRIHTTRHFTPVRCRAVTTRHSDHRFVVADLRLD